ncbi:YceG family protein [Bacillus aquiflavi]|uniref:YceG family protein n=1 Tax=Bacillus aquiflavi TaxID=2672567 RepID=UPI001CA9730B|nr:YceG family protein [Bacillus aquiflavi]UAC46965.1 YceG family protein [Bacillus aquiflavi]
MFPSYNQLHTHILPLSYENWLTTLKKSINERPQYKLENGTIHIGQVLVRFLGIPFDEDEYYNNLFEYVRSKDVQLHLLSEESIDKTIDNHQFQAIQKVLQIHREQKLSINRFVAFLDGEQLLLKSSNHAVHRKIRESMIDLLSTFETLENNGLSSSDLRRVLVDVVKWTNNHLKDLLINADPEKEMPKFLWYGEATKSHQYFLYYLMKIGCDIMMFHPDGTDVLQKFDPNQELTFVHTYPEKKEPEPFPTEKRRRTSTVAYRASREIESILNHEGSGLYKPWQLRDYTPSSVTLKTTYDELFLLIKEKAMIRPNFEVKNGEVKIPSIFAKVQGVSKNRKEYWDRIHGVIQLEDCLLIKRFPFTSNINNDFRFHYRNSLDKDGLLNPDKIMNAHFWKYGHLPGGLQKGIANAVKNICRQPHFKPIHQETEEDVKMYLFTQAMQIPASILKLLQKFDYSQDVPKLILYNNELNGTMTRPDAALLLLLNHFGIDIVLYNPPGQNDIENYLDESLYDIHWLEDVVFEQEFKEPSIFKRMFSQNIFKNLRGD